MNVLVLATRDITIHSFLIPIIKELESSKLFENIYIASSCDRYGDVLVQEKCGLNIKCLPVYALNSKFLFPFNVILDVVQLVKLLRELDKDLVFTHTPLISHLVRIASFFRATNVLYYVHGFRFTSRCKSFKSSAFKLIEKVLSIRTSGYILINKEDYDFARWILRKRSYFVDGVGVSNRFYSYNCAHSGRKSAILKILVVAAYKDEKGYPDILFLADWLNKNYRNIYIDCYGYGCFMRYQKSVEAMGIKNISFHAYSGDLLPVFKQADLFLSASRREGLPVSVMEAMCTGKIVVASDIRGNRDLVDSHQNGFLYDVDDPNTLITIVDDVAKAFFVENYDGYLDIPKIRSAAKSSCIKRFSRKRLAENTVEILKDFL